MASEGTWKLGRVPLDAISGIRFFCTGMLLAAHATESLWNAQGDDALWLQRDTCAFLKRSNKDLVCFYFVLAGFTMNWGYAGRDFVDWQSKFEFAKRRFARFYPDYFIAMLSSLLCSFVAPCHETSTASVVFNLVGLTLLPSWAYGAGPGYLNGPAWFMGTLFWLWMIFPFVVKPVRSFFPENDTLMWFCLKICLLGAVSFIPWTIPLMFRPDGVLGQGVIADAFNSFNNSGQPLWSFWYWIVKPSPLFRLPEFVMGMGLAIRVRACAQIQYATVDTSDGGGEKVQGEGKETMVACLPLLCTLLPAAFYIYKVVTWDSSCTCMDWRFVTCFGIAELFDTRFVLFNAAIIYGVATLDVRRAMAATQAPRPPLVSARLQRPWIIRSKVGTAAEACEANFRDNVGFVGTCTWRFLTFPLFVHVGQWGLQLFLYQSVAYFFFGYLAVRLHWIGSYCEPVYISGGMQVLCTLGKIALAYTMAWLMQSSVGPVGKLIAKNVDILLFGKPNR